MSIQSVDDNQGRKLFYLIAFLLIHPFLGMLMMAFHTLSTLHVMVTLAVGMYVALLDDRIDRVATVGAYIIGSEVLWRMTSAQMFWETAKYGMAAIFMIALFRKGRFRVAALPLIYLACLLPSTLMVLVEQGMSDARDAISFNLSGPFALAMASTFFFNVNLSRKQLEKVFLALVAGTLAIAGVALNNMVGDPHMPSGFGQRSNYVASGGFGPNQVSSILGLGVLLLLFILFQHGVPWARRVLFWGCLLWLGSQCVLTFSRGGFYNLAFAAIVAVPFLVKDPGSRARLIIAALSLVIAANYLILPMLESYTRGNLSTRYESVDSTGRLELVVADLDLWSEHPILGVGPGQAEFLRPSGIGPMAAHTEYTRLVAEHGVLGLAALFLILIAGFRRIMSAQSDMAKAICASVFAWSLFNMLHAGMRVAAPSFMFALTYSTLLSEENIEYCVITTTHAIKEKISDYASLETNL